MPNNIKTIFSYGLLAFPLALLGINYYLFLPSIYIKHYGASLGTIGIYLMLARFWDAITDPLIGWISDKLIEKGKTRFYLLFLGFVLIIPSTLILFNPTLLPIDNTLIFILSSLSFFLALTLISVPYETLGIEFSSNVVLRSKMLACRDGFFLFGTIGASALPFFINQKLKEVSDRQIFQSLIYLVILTLTIVILISALKTQVRTQDKVNRPKVTLGIIKQAILNRNFLILLLAFIISSLGAALPASLFMFFTQVYLGLSEESAIISLLIYFIIGLGSVPLWLKFSNKYSKKYVWFSAQIINAGAFLPVFFLNNSNYFLFNPLIAISALGLGGTIILPSILQADHISAMATRHNAAIEGAIVGIWSIAKKLAQGLGTGLGFYILSLTEFDASATNNSYTAITTLGLLYSVIPSVLCLFSILIAANYKLHNE